MLPPGLAKLTPGLLALVRETASEAIDLREIWRGLGFDPIHPGRQAINRWTAELSRQGVSYRDAVDYYNAAKFWVNQSTYLTQYKPDDLLPPGLVRHLSTTKRFAGDYATFRTNVEITVRDPATGETKVYYRWISTTMAPTASELYEQAYDDLDIDVATSPTVGGRNSLHGLDVSYRITDYGVYM